MNSIIFTETKSCNIQEEDADITIFSGGEITKKSIIKISTENEVLNVAVLWDHYADSNMLHTHWSEINSVLFIGAGSISAVVDVKAKSIVHQNHTCLFLCWVSIKEFILEMGELECRLYKENGELIGETSVDPPYDYTVTDDAIIFNSCILGYTSITFAG